MKFRKIVIDGNLKRQPETQQSGRNSCCGRYWQSEYDGRVDKEFVVNFGMSRNAKEPQFSKMPSQLKKNQIKSSIGNFQNITHL